MFDMNPELIDQLVQRELNKTKMAEEYAIKPEEKPKPQNVTALDPKWSMLLGGLADAASTYTFLNRGTSKERNKAFQYFNGKPWTVAPTAAAVGMGYNAVHNWMKKKNPKIANTISGLVGGYQMALGGNNLENTLDPGKNASSYSKAAKDLMLKGTN